MAYFGEFDVLVGVLCVAAVHAQARRKDGFAGNWLAIGALLKFLPIVLLPFLVFRNRVFLLRLFIWFVATLTCGFALSVAIWGWSTFSPLVFAGARAPVVSIYNAAAQLLPLNELSLTWFEKPIIALIGLLLFAFFMWKGIEAPLACAVAVLATLLFYRSGWNNYQMVPFLLVSYWAAVNWKLLSGRFWLNSALIGYFSWLSIMDVVYSIGHRFLDLASSDALLTDLYLVRFVLGCALLFGLVRFGVWSAEVRRVLEEDGVALSGKRTSGERPVSGSGSAASIKRGAGREANCADVGHGVRDCRKAAGLQRSFCGAETEEPDARTSWKTCNG